MANGSGYSWRLLWPGICLFSAFKEQQQHGVKAPIPITGRHRQWHSFRSLCSGCPFATHYSHLRLPARASASARSGTFCSCCRLVNYRQMAWELRAAQCKQAINSIKECTASSWETEKWWNGKQRNGRCSRPGPGNSPSERRGWDKRIMHKQRGAHTDTHTHRRHAVQSARHPGAQWSEKHKTETTKQRKI